MSFSTILETVEWRIPRGRKGMRLDAALGLTPMRAILDALVVDGVEHVRASAAWPTLEPSNGVFNWSTTDNVVNEAQARSMTVSLTTDGMPGWLNPNGFWVPPRSAGELAAWQTFAQTMAARYAGRGVIYECWNEPDQGAFWKAANGSTGAPDPTEYAPVLRSFYLGIKAGDPHGQVAGMVTNRTRLGYIGAVYDALESQFTVPTCQANNYFFDILALHPYCLTHPPNYAPSDDTTDTWGTVCRRFEDFSRGYDLVFTRQGFHKPLIFGEFGYSTTQGSNGPITDATRAVYVPLAYQAMRTPGYVHSLSWFTYAQSSAVDFDIRGTASEDAYGDVPSSEGAPSVESHVAGKKMLFAAPAYGSIGVVPQTADSGLISGSVYVPIHICPLGYSNQVLGGVVVGDVETLIGRQFHGLRQNQAYTTTGVTTAVNEYDAGRTTSYRAIQFDTLPGGWAAAATGAADTQLTTFCTNVTNAHRWTTQNPFIVCLHHEATLSPFGTTGFLAADYKAMWQHCVPVMLATGAPIAFALVGWDRMFVGANGVGPPTAGQGIDDVDPGSSLYTYIGSDVYNAIDSPGVLRYGVNAATLLAPIRNAAVSRGKDWMIGEMGCEDGTTAQDHANKAMWLDSLRVYIDGTGATSPGVCRAMLTTIKASAENYNVDSSPEALLAWQRLGGDVFYA